jgi:predicted DNA-binding protein
VTSKKDLDDDTWPSVVRIPEAARERLARVGTAMSKAARAELPPAVVLRAVLERGLAEMEDALGLSRRR